ncbi:two-component system regulatory protein YycI [Oceanobacillus saliphilus]|uniref:two-component system regulatory protein YycI n=1 Tax=Oceanobacillus saliphilus TaxID=2925834 RepID=UPI00201DA93E|nr:two-component system regulatory protein YycI [Oceanobacillus saliphilus]
MQWGHIKTLFILSFLILNIYLLVQFVDRQRDSDIGVLDSEDQSYEELFESENISLPDLNEDVTEANYINVSEITFTSEEIDQLNSMEDIAATLVEDNFILTQFEKPLPLPENADVNSITALLAPYMLYPSEYTYWAWNEETNILIFFQEIDNNRTIYFNQNALLLFYINDNDEITHYTQTMLGEAEQQGNAETLLPQINAIGSLYDRGSLAPDEDVTDVELGYLSRIESQVFAPTWRITIDEEENYFINAIENLTYPGEDMEFLQTTIDKYMDKIEILPEDNELKEPFTAVINQKFETENRSEPE